MPQRSASATPLPRLVDLNKFPPPLAETQSTLAPILESQVGYQGEDGYFKTLTHNKITKTSLNKSPALHTQVGKQLKKLYLQIWN